MELDRLKKLAGFGAPITEATAAPPYHPNLTKSGTGKEAQNPMLGKPHLSHTTPRTQGPGPRSYRVGTGKAPQLTVKESLIELANLLEADEGEFPDKVKEVLGKVRDLHRAGMMAKKNGDMGEHKRIHKGMSEIHSKICSYWNTHCT